MSKVLILEKTKNGRKAKPILKTEANDLVSKGLAVKLPDGIYKYLDKKVIEQKEPKPKKKTYKTKVIKAED